MRSVERNNLCSDSAPFCKTDQMAQMDSVPKRTAKAGQEFLHAKFGDILHCLSQSTDLNPIEQVLQWKISRIFSKQEMQRLMISRGSRLPAVTD